MRAIHDPFTREMRNRLEITVMGLGLMRLLQDAGRIEEARAILCLLETGSPGAAEKTDRAARQRGANRRQRMARRRQRLVCLRAG